MTDLYLDCRAPEVRALLAGRKSQVRRVLKPKKRVTILDCTVDAGPALGGMARRLDLPLDLFQRPYAVGDRLYVREAHQFANSGDGPCVLMRATSSRWSPEWTGPDESAGPSYDYDRYPGDYSRWAADVESADTPWRPSIHMPRWASRLTLLVTDVRVQRLQEISEDDAKAEGAREIYGEPFASDSAVTDRRRFELLWNFLHGPDAWAANSWVAAIAFTVHRANIDALAPAATLDIAGAA